MISIRLTLAVAVLASTSTIGHAEESASAVNFRRQIAPLLSKFGCNAGSCHGAAEGQGGFKLSLFGFDSAADYRAIVADDAERVANSPRQSLLLLKPSGGLEHEGGKLFEVNSPAYALLTRWISQGAVHEELAELVELSIVPSHVGLSPARSASDLQVVARFADESILDVTSISRLSVRDESLAKLDGRGRLTRVANGGTSVIAEYGGRSASAAVWIADDVEHELKFDPPANEIDRWIDQKLRRLQISPAERAGDYVFLRRLYLSGRGRLPNPAEVRSFVADTRSDKRAQAIDDALASPSHASMWATRMCEITGSREHLPTEPLAAERHQRRWHEWFRVRFANNMPYDQIARGILTATSRDQHSPQEFIRRCAERPSGMIADAEAYAAKPTLELYWARRVANERVDLESLAERTAAAFLGVRMECARCHKHPFDRWTQNDHRSFANIFAQVRYGLSPELRLGLSNALEERRALVAAGKNPPKIPSVREVYVSTSQAASLRDAATRLVLKPTPLGAPHFEPSEDHRQQLVNWLVRSDNPYFARNFVNRVWAFYFGHGITEPVDAFAASNPPSHPELLDWLSKEFVASGYDIRQLERLILSSNAWQRSASTDNQGASRSGDRNYARFQVQILPASVIVDAIADVAGSSQDRAVDSPMFQPETALAPEYFQVFDRPERSATCDCESSRAPSLRQTMLLLSDDALLESLRRGIAQDTSRIRSNRRLVNRLFLSTLSRPPTRNERRSAIQHLDAAKNRMEAIVDLSWSLMTTREFVTNH